MPLGTTSLRMQASWSAVASTSTPRCCVWQRATAEFACVCLGILLAADVGQAEVYRGEEGEEDAGQALDDEAFGNQTIGNEGFSDKAFGDQAIGREARAD